MDEKTVARFWSKVDKSAGPGGCWLWTGSIALRGGYGTIRVGGRGGRTLLAHRVSATLSGADVKGAFVCHHCDNPPCVNPKHLFVGSPKDNNDDKVAKGRARGGRNFGNRNGRLGAEYSDATIMRIREAYGDGWKFNQIARGTGLHRAYVRSVCLGQIRTDLPIVQPLASPRHKRLDDHCAVPPIAVELIRDPKVTPSMRRLAATVQGKESE